ncbi:transporter substrate-binding domain-containing protein [Tabrizicola sp.]|jgi:polar amino acid transport system substrate-binding protein|uniref:transporter substrate-binding domain-containing protein n=1 Tax=Tabrizicola sp. TaxID=2005166 RepID=UPI001A4BB7E8|nr:transporter substrate-binding domain-containing protein [Tabrizicola sp.]MBL9064574.1 transporter substrate-binding domain-containing protein [Tabrizicola sp.]
MKRLLIATALVAVSGTAWAQDVVRLGTEGAYPPYNFINDAGEVAGFEREFGDELCKRAGLTCSWTTNDWDSIIPNLQSGNYDVIVAGMSITPERQEIVDFSQPYLQPTPSAYLALSKDADLMSGPVAAQTSTIQAAFVAENGMQVVEFATPEETVAAVKNGEAVAVLADSDYLKPIADESNGELVLLDKTESIGGGVGMAFRKSDKELHDKLDAAIKSMKCDGTLDAMIQKPEYFGPNSPLAWGDKGKEGC